MRQALERRWRAGIGLKRVLIAGAGELGRLVADRILEHRDLGLHDRRLPRRPGRAATTSATAACRCSARSSEAGEIAQREKVDQLYVALPLDQHHKVVQVVEGASREGVDIKVVPDLLQFIALRARLEELDGVPIININDVPLQGLNSVIKRTVDLVLSAVALVVLAVPLAFVALLVKLTSPGPVFYHQERMGLDGRAFTVYKFRSMFQDAERETGPIWAEDDDPRCTPLGRILRRFDIDELPQIWNVFKGDMSLVGPRPERPYFVEQFKQQYPQYMLRHKVRAGITGWAQVNGWRGQHVAREADRVRPVLHRELVAPPRPQDHVADPGQGLLQTRLLRPPSSMSKPRVVITGAAGFIGSHLAETLLDLGYAVVGIDNLLTGDIANVAHLVNRDFLFIKHDVTNYIYIDGPVDVVLHWASPASPIDYLELPIPTLKVGALGTHKALGLAKAKNARFVLASTSEVYGDPLEHPQKETYWGNVNPIGPRGRVRRGEAVRRGDDGRLPPLPRRRHEDRPHLQHLRPADARQRRPRGADVHPAGAARRRHHDLRRRQPDAQLHLHQRPGGRRHPADDVEPERAGEHRQPARDDDRGDRARRSSG